MDQIGAMGKLLILAGNAGMDTLSSDTPELDFPHLESMFDRARHADPPFSEAKLGRWLGWMQAAVVAANIGLSLEDMKKLNMEFSGNE